MANDKLAKLKKDNGGKVNKDEFMDAVRGTDMTEAELK